MINIKIIDGKKIALEITNNLKSEIKNLDISPGLAIIFIGSNPNSEIYIKNKIKKCTEIGINAQVFKFASTDSSEKIENCIKSLNHDDSIDGIIIQSPVPKPLDEEYLNSFITPTKDVDGFGIYNIGSLASNKNGLVAATPLGIMHLLEHEKINVAGKHVVIVGRSKIVGRPLALLMLNHDATVTIAHSKTKNLREITKTADILIVAIGNPKYIDKSYVKEGTVVIDVGISRVESKIYGDIDFESVKTQASYITPVPGGVGPMTIAMLLSNVVESCKNKLKKEKEV